MRSQASRHFGDKGRKTALTLAVGEFWTDRESGHRKKRTDFLTTFTFNKKIADFILAHVKPDSSCHDRRSNPLELL